MPADRLRRVYDLETQEETDAYYTNWAATYDEELERNGYRTPARCVEALALFVPFDQPVLDVGCGTGLSGAALAAGGFVDVSGQDVNQAMLDVARQRGVYRDLRLADLDDPFPFEPGTYAACSAIGVIGFGAAPASLLGEVLDALASGGHLVFSYNDLAVDDPHYAGALADVISSGTAEQVAADYGPHFDALGSESMVYVLRRT
ncbi:MAG: class I SAM-dependent methyltransferase [Ilumatobacter sp.]|uniref:class I SAM-dependent DNA methyltransferase n=1 Tax=Ilumatobacter sp. TaxID=1967498 RepID=UPI003C7926E7